MYKRILLAVDGSEHSLRAAKEAMKLGEVTTNCIIDAVHVVEFSKSKTEILHAQSQEELELKKREQLQPVEKLLTQSKICADLKFYMEKQLRQLLNMLIKKTWISSYWGVEG